jgi:phage shock protein PspC (stress-responsive transcriptional regulator)
MVVFYHSLTDYFGWDLTLVWVNSALLFLVGGNGFLLSLLLWILTLLEPSVN